MHARRARERVSSRKGIQSKGAAAELQAAAGFVRQQDGFGDLAHALAGVHAQPLDAAEGFGFLEALRVHQHAFGAFDELARLEDFLRLGEVLLDLADLAPPLERHLDSRFELLLGKGLDQVAHHARVDGPIDELAIRVRGEQQDWRHALLGQDQGRGDAVLLGHSDDNGAQDIGRLRVTYHHNFFDGSIQRNPRVRFGEPVHVFNNYYLHITGYGVASQMNAGVLVEGNFFDDVEKPTRNDVGGDRGRIVARNNVNINTEDPIVTSGTVVEPRTFYSYTVDDPATLPSTVPAGAGVGKI